MVPGAAGKVLLISGDCPRAVGGHFGISFLPRTLRSCLRAPQGPQEVTQPGPSTKLPGAAFACAGTPVTAPGRRADPLQRPQVDARHPRSAPQRGLFHYFLAVSGPPPPLPFQARGGLAGWAWRPRVPARISGSLALQSILFFLLWGWE